MGIKNNLRAFCDPQYSNFSGFPSSSAEAVVKWSSAIGPEIDKFLLPSLPSGLISAPSIASGAFATALAANPIYFQPTGPNNLAIGLNVSMKAAATAVQSASTAFVAVAPTQSFKAESLFGLTFSALEVCQNIEDRVEEWLKTGTYTAWLTPTYPGTPNTKWGISIPEPPDSDGDGYYDSEDDKPNNPDKH